MRVARPLALLALLAACTTASAFWLAAGSGSGSASSLPSPAPLTISGATPSGLVLPTGAPTGDVRATITNANPFPVRIHALELDPAGGGGFSANAADCALSYVTQTNAGAGWTVPAGGSLDVTLTDALTMGTGAADTCQGQTFTVHLRAS